MIRKISAWVTQVVLLSGLVLGTAISQPATAIVIDEDGTESNKMRQIEETFRGHEPWRGAQLPYFNGTRGDGLPNDIGRGYNLPKDDRARGYAPPEHAPDPPAIDLSDLYYLTAQLYFNF